MRNFPVWLSVCFSPVARGPGRVPHLHNLPCSFFCGVKKTGQINRRKKFHWRLKHKDLTFGSGSLWAANCGLTEYCGEVLLHIALFLVLILRHRLLSPLPEDRTQGCLDLGSELLWLLLRAGLGLCFFNYSKSSLQRPRERRAEAFPPLPHFPFCLFSQRLKFCILYCSVHWCSVIDVPYSFCIMHLFSLCLLFSIRNRSGIRF